MLFCGGAIDLEGSSNTLPTNVVLLSGVSYEGFSLSILSSCWPSWVPSGVIEYLKIKPLLVHIGKKIFNTI